MTRYDIINHLIKKNGYTRYLEIGTQADNCLKEIKCDYKVGIDPKPIFHESTNSNRFYRMESDTYFCKLKDTFDIIFVDGFHEALQMYKDVLNSLGRLREGGCIVVHDCNPRDKESQTPAYMEDGVWRIPHTESWNGDVWKGWVKLRNKKNNLSMFVIDTDQGCGVIQKGEQKCIKIDIPVEKVNYEHLVKNRKEWLNLITVKEFKNDYSIISSI